MEGPGATVDLHLEPVLVRFERPTAPPVVTFEADPAVSADPTTKPAARAVSGWRRARWGPEWDWVVLLLAVGAAATVFAWIQLGPTMAVVVGVGGTILTVGLWGAVLLARWHPMRDRSRIVPRLPTVAVLAMAVAVALVPGRIAWTLARDVLYAGSTSVVLPPLAGGSTVFDANGQPVAAFHGGVILSPVPLSAVAPVMVTAVIDTEDVRFWSHGGVDFLGVLRAGAVDAFGSSGRQGGSTIAMQLVKNTLLANQPDNLNTKLQEVVLADRLERSSGRTAVLQDYLNTVYFGEGAYGVQAAAEEYFDVPASQLDASQAALLAGLIQSPSGYDPLRHPAAAANRRRTVLGLMVAHHDLTPAQADAAATSPLPSEGHPPPSQQDYFLAAVEQELLADPALGPTPPARYHALFYGRLQIHTTLDPKFQLEAISAVDSGLPPDAPMPLSAALVAIDPASGAVRAVVGGPSFASSQFDAALAAPGRPTGSAFKVFTLVTALEQGWEPSDVIDGSSPCAIPDPGNNPDPWVVSNNEGEAFGSISLDSATADSVNCAFARLAMRVGLLRIAQVAQSMGVTAPLDVVPSMTLGTNSVPPLQMASAYATLAAAGVYHRPYLVTEVDAADGHALLTESSPSVRVLDSTVAGTATQVLQTVVERGTGTAAALPGQRVAGKTGTSQNFSDAWFVGYTPRLATAVWMGSPSGEVPMTDVGGINVVGGSYPARIWHSFMSAAEAGH